MRRHMRRAITGLACVVLSTGIVAMATQPVKIDFEKDEVGKAPRAFSFALTGQGKAGLWVVQKDDAAHGNVVVQTDSDRTDYRFPLAIYNDFSAKDVDLSVQFKAISGKGDQGAGLVWRDRGQSNHYWDPGHALGGNSPIYLAVEGRAVAFPAKNAKGSTQPP